MQKIGPAPGVSYPLHSYDFCILKVELKMNNFRSNLGGAPAKKNGTWGLFGLDHVWTMFVFFYVPLMTHPGVNQQSTSLEHLLMLFFEQNLFILTANRAGLGSHSKWTNFVQETRQQPLTQTCFNKRHYGDRFHRIVNLKLKKQEKNQCGGGGKAGQ